MYNAFVSCPAPYGTIIIHCDEDYEICDIFSVLTSRLPASILDICYLTAKSRASIKNDFHLSLTARLLGGKGGFGSQLRAAGGRMRKGQKPNTDSMKDQHGRRLRTLKKAQALAEALRDAPEKERKARTEERDRLMAILAKELPGARNLKFDDEEYLTQSETLLEDIRTAIETSESHNTVDESSSDHDLDTEDGASGSDFKKVLADSYDRADKTKQLPKRLSGWDEDDDQFDAADSSDEEDLTRHDGLDQKERDQALHVGVDSPSPDAKRRKL